MKKCWKILKNINEKIKKYWRRKDWRNVAEKVNQYRNKRNIEKKLKKYWKLIEEILKTSWRNIEIKLKKYWKQIEEI